MAKLKEKSLSRGSFRTHGRVIGNKNFFIFGLRTIQNIISYTVHVFALFSAPQGHF